MIYTAYYPSPVGKMLLAERDGALIGLWFVGQKYFPDPSGEETAERDTALLVQTKSWLDRYFAGERPSVPELLLAPRGSDFRQRVWRMLCDIPYGETVTYGELARRLSAENGGRPMSAQAVGGAVGHNRISVIIPCHRVVGGNGSLTGYAGGMERKLWLLWHEGADTSGLFIPHSSTAP